MALEMVAMMVAMMLPSLIPVLSRWRAAVRRARHIQAGGAIVLVGLGYFCVWTAFGMLIFAVGVALAGIEMQWAVLGRAVPIASGVVMLIAGAVQFTEWKAHHLACSREAPKCALALSTHPTTAFRHGLRLGLHCSLCCANLTMVLLVLGVMDLRAMAAVSLAITVERLAPACKRMAREIGALVLGAGVLVLAQAAGLSG